MFTITYSRVATRTLRRIPANAAATIREKIAELAENPNAPNANVQPLRGRDELRLRFGDWRVIYRIDQDAETIRVRLIRPRGSAYR